MLMLMSALSSLAFACAMLMLMLVLMPSENQPLRMRMMQIRNVNTVAHGIAHFRYSGRMITDKAIQNEAQGKQKNVLGLTIVFPWASF